MNKDINSKSILTVSTNESKDNIIKRLTAKIQRIERINKELLAENKRLASLILKD